MPCGLPVIVNGCHLKCSVFCSSTCSNFVFIDAVPCNVFEYTYFITAGNVVRGNQKLCMLNPYESFRT